MGPKKPGGHSMEMDNKTEWFMLADGINWKGREFRRCVFTLKEYYTCEWRKTSAHT